MADQNEKKKNGEVRIQKAIADSGAASRRAAEELITAGTVTVNGRPAHIGQKVDPAHDIIAINGNKLDTKTKKRYYYIVLNKPRGYVTTLSDEQGRKCVADLLQNIPERVYPVGRLDRNSEGLLLLTNDGDFANRVMHPSFGISKAYRVTVRPDVTDKQAVQLTEGVVIDGVKTAPAQVEVLEKSPGRVVMSIIITEGRNRQIRKMCEAVGLEVARLKRVSEGPVRLGMLQPGQWRDLTEAELTALRSGSSSGQRPQESRGQRAGNGGAENRAAAGNPRWNAGENAQGRGGAENRAATGNPRWNAGNSEQKRTGSWGKPEGGGQRPAAGNARWKAGDNAQGKGGAENRAATGNPRWKAGDGEQRRTGPGGAKPQGNWHPQGDRPTAGNARWKAGDNAQGNGGAENRAATGNPRWKAGDGEQRRTGPGGAKPQGNWHPQGDRPAAGNARWKAGDNAQGNGGADNRAATGNPRWKAGDGEQRRTGPGGAKPQGNWHPQGDRPAAGNARWKAGDNAQGKGGAENRAATGNPRWNAGNGEQKRTGSWGKPEGAQHKAGTYPPRPTGGPHPQERWADRAGKNKTPGSTWGTGANRAEKKPQEKRFYKKSK